MFVRLFVSVLMFALTPALARADASPGAWTPKSGDTIRFTVLRDGNAFGSHAVRFETRPDGTLVATTTVALKAGLGPVTLFRYNLNAAETWQNGKLTGVKGSVNDDGKKRMVKATRDGETLNVDGTDFKGAAPAGVVPASHWNFAQTKSQRLLSTEDGEILKVKIANLGREKIKAGGKSIYATRYLLDSALDVELWYDDAGRWVKLAFEARGQKIDYVLDSLY